MYRMLLFLVLVCVPLNAGSQEGLKVFISVDMEGLAGVVVSEECSRSGDDYGLFRKIMTLETNAAIEGAVAAGATEIIVRDSHGAKRNILPDLLDPRAKLLRGESGATKNMMDRLDESFDAVMFIGYHAKGRNSRCHHRAHLDRQRNGFFHQRRVFAGSRV